MSNRSQVRWVRDDPARTAVHGNEALEQEVAAARAALSLKKTAVANLSARREDAAGLARVDYHAIDTLWDEIDQVGDGVRLISARWLVQCSRTAGCQARPRVHETAATHDDRASQRSSLGQLPLSPF